MQPDSTRRLIDFDVNSHLTGKFVTARVQNKVEVIRKWAHPCR